LYSQLNEDIYTQEDLRLRKVKINTIEKRLNTEIIHNSHYNSELEKVLNYIEMIKLSQDKYEQHKLDLSMSANVDFTTVKNWSLDEIMNFTKLKNNQIELQNAIKK
jgi:hypothetical protein